MPFYTQKPIPEEIIDTRLNTFVPVIASYNTKGQCKPLYFQFTYPDGQTEAIAIDRVISVDCTSVYGAIYHCAVTICDCRRYVDLFYHYKPHRWTIKKWSGG